MPRPEKREAQWKHNKQEWMTMRGMRQEAWNWGGFASLHRCYNWRRRRRRRRRGCGVQATVAVQSHSRSLASASTERTPTAWIPCAFCTYSLSTHIHTLSLLLPSLFIAFSFSMLHRTLAPSASNPEACLLLPDDALISPLVNHSDATFCREIMVVGCFGWSGKSILFQGEVFARFPGYWKRFWSNIGLLLVDRRFKSFGKGKCKAEMWRSYTTGIVKMIVNLGQHNAT